MQPDTAAVRTKRARRRGSVMWKSSAAALQIEPPEHIGVDRFTG
jgi:hypothetical protein